MKANLYRIALVSESVSGLTNLIMTVVNLDSSRKILE